MKNREGLDEWLAETAWHRRYWVNVKEEAAILGADGCTGVPDWYGWTCLEHDIHYRTHQFTCGCPIDREQADYILRVRIQQASPLGKFSPVSWVRWLGVRLLAQRAWDHE